MNETISIDGEKEWSGDQYKQAAWDAVLSHFTRARSDVNVKVIHPSGWIKELYKGRLVMMANGSGMVIVERVLQWTEEQGKVIP